MSRHLMLVPSLACPASCAYCFGPHESSQIMSNETLEALLQWQSSLNGNDALEITFHGGEPLVPGVKFYSKALPFLQESFSAKKIRFAMQSNLWLLDNELCDLLREYKVSVGTSLDGPEGINDAQRGQGYFKKTMAGIERARSHGINIGCICTFTRQSIEFIDKIFDFFLREGLNFSVHSALPSLRYPNADRWSLSAEKHGELLEALLHRYLDNLNNIQISTLDALCRSVSARTGGICTFWDCLGDYLALGPNGDIYPCQRFAGMPEYRIGNVHQKHSWEKLSASSVWLAFQDRQNRIEEECGDCAYLDICRGGCPYNALVANGGSFEKSLRDPHCEAYKQTFNLISDLALKEVFSQENLDEVVNRPDSDKGLLRSGKLLSLVGDGPHPSQTAQHARRILAAVALAATGSPVEATRKFEQLGLTSNISRTRRAMEAFHQRLNAPVTGLNNIYLHVTFACNLRCSHCYAQAGSPRNGNLAVADIVAACQQSAQLGFRHVVITGGELLVHPQRDMLLDELARIRLNIKPTLTVLRTSLALSMDNELLMRLSRSTDQVVVSLDGDQETHDARRGEGSYQLTVGNLRALIALDVDTNVSLATVLPLSQANGAPGRAVRSLAKELGIKRTRFRPLLPLGRAEDSQLDILPETIWGHVDPREMVAYGFTPTSSCGIGQNLYVEPDGNAYPCYAWHGDHWNLGNITADGGLPGLVAGEAFQDLGNHTVNTNHACRNCPLRYLCGGACRAWNRQPAEEQLDLDAPPLDCSHLHSRARSLLLSALAYLEISDGKWLSSGLLLPDKPPIEFQN